MNLTRTALTILAVLGLTTAHAQLATPVDVGAFTQQISEHYTLDGGPEANDVRDIFVMPHPNVPKSQLPEGAADLPDVFAATSAGVAALGPHGWALDTHYKVDNTTHLMLPHNATRYVKPRAIADGGLHNSVPQGGNEHTNWFPVPLRGEGLITDILVRHTGHIYVTTTRGLYGGKDPENVRLFEGWNNVTAPKPNLRAIAGHTGDTMAVAAESGLYYRDDEDWRRLFPHDESRSWAVTDVRDVAFDEKGHLWFASPQGVGVFDGEWTLYDGSDGLPYNDFTCVAPLDDGTAWFGTTKGAIYFDGEDFRYRQGLRWLPNDDVRDIEIDLEGTAWFATADGIGVIRNREMTLAEKAKFYEDEIDNYHRRTPYEFVLQVSVPEAGVKENISKHDSDNDGLWTCMYGAGECFAWAATGDPKAKERAKKAFDAMRFLGTVTQGAEHSPPPGYVARTVLPGDGPNPNDGRYERDLEEQKSDKLWKAYEPRWPKSADGEWYFKTDTSSDELDGHYFLYGLYYDLVADTMHEKLRVRAQIKGLTDHMIEHGFNLVDVDGTPTRWGRFSPEEMNFDRDWFAERGLNSLSMLSYLYTTAHITGDDHYREVAQMLIDEHSYAQNLLYPKFQRGPGTGNQSDDEMAFMSFYNLMKYTENADLKERAAQSWWHYWRIEQPELNPFFNFAFAAMCDGATYTDAWRTYTVGPVGTWLEESIDTLKRFPLDRFDWAHTNTHRTDLDPMPDWSVAFDDRRPAGRAMRVNGRVLPVDERHFSHWNHDPYRLNTGGQGRSLSDGAVFLLPYYMGLYHGFIAK